MDAPPPAYTESDPHPQPRPTLDNASQVSQTSLPGPSPNTSSPTSFVSGSPYFAMHPPTRRPNCRLTTASILVVRGTRKEDLPLPPQLQKGRGRLDTDDWKAFLSHLLPDRREETHVQARYEKSGTISTRVQPNQQGETPDVADAHLSQVVDEWNEGFFLPRGISIALQTEVPEASALPAAISNDRNKLGEALYESIKKGDLSTIKLLLSHGADPNYRPSCSTPSIVRAVKKENIELVRLLLERGADLEVTAPAAETALWAAVKAKNVDIVRMLLLYGAKVDTAHPSGSDPCLYRAVVIGKLEIVKMLLDQHPDLEKSPPGGSTSLYRAAKDGNILLAQMLLRYGAKANCWPPGGCSAFYRAAEKNNLPLTKLLIEHGADVNFTPYSHNSALYEAVKREDLQMVKLLLDSGADINKRSSGNKSPLTYASKHGLNSLVKLLLEAGGHAEKGLN
ncbi:uncharacterized protein KY384_006467 [Bacidia gigantensis]|uniref:uncharacterized protein n=1 Tax=Bacidia gigantensis TaxID=2732470 RepID=UPI001D03A228|nr:uncharacterized protein KY384_006467 [Bacidia gigantensis]KAG8528779.1 hypothetical protein KY384_006467 [Bacidia gigantensis]